MRFHLIAVGTRMPSWVTAGYQEYTRRLPHECTLHLIEIPPCKRRKTLSVARIKEAEGRQILAAVPEQACVVAMDAAGSAWDTQTLASRMQGWMHDGRDICLLVGGPDGLSQDCLERADIRWSLSAHTLPHALVRVMIAEQIYRAWTILAGHPYHRS